MRGVRAPFYVDVARLRYVTRCCCYAVQRCRAVDDYALPTVIVAIAVADSAAPCRVTPHDVE